MDEHSKQLLEIKTLIEAEEAKLALLQSIRSQANVFLPQNLLIEAPHIYQEVRKLKQDQSLNFKDALNYLHDVQTKNLQRLDEQRKLLESQVKSLPLQQDASHQPAIQATSTTFDQSSDKDGKEEEEEKQEDLNTESSAGNRRKDDHGGDDADGDGSGSASANTGGSLDCPQDHPASGDAATQGDHFHHQGDAETGTENSDAAGYFNALSAIALMSVLDSSSLHALQGAHLPGASWVQESAPSIIGAASHFLAHSA